MTLRVERNKWILYRHTSDFDLVCAVAVYLKNYTKASISAIAQKKLILKLKELGLYKERNAGIPLDSINHRINTLAYFMFGYKNNIDGEKMFLFSPLGNLFLKYIKDRNKLSKIFLTMLWAFQFPDPHFNTSKSFNLYPFRLIFKLLTDERLARKLFAYEVEYLVVFVESIDSEKYEALVNNILAMRELSDDDIAKEFNSDPHAYVNAAHEWDYYISRLFQSAGLWKKEDGETICRLKHGNTKTYRKITKSTVALNPEISDYCVKLLREYPFDEKPLRLDDEERLTIDVTKEIYGFYPRLLLDEIGDVTDIEELSDLLRLTKLIEKYSTNEEGKEAYLFEEILEWGFNNFYNVEAKRIGGAGKTDIECLYTSKNKKFAVDAKSTRNKLSGLNTARLKAHRDKIGGEYTIVVTPRYVPAVKQDISSTEIVILRASTFSEYLYNCINSGIRKIDYAQFDDIISKKLGCDISSDISRLTLNKFGVSEKV